MTLFHQTYLRFVKLLRTWSGNSMPRSVVKLGPNLNESMKRTSRVTRSLWKSIVHPCLMLGFWHHWKHVEKNHIPFDRLVQFWYTSQFQDIKKTSFFCRIRLHQFKKGASPLGEEYLNAYATAHCIWSLPLPTLKNYYYYQEGEHILYYNKWINNLPVYLLYVGIKDCDQPLKNNNISWKTWNEHEKYVSLLWREETNQVLLFPPILIVVLSYSVRPGVAKTLAVCWGPNGKMRKQPSCE